MKALITVTTAICILLGIITPASAFEGGARKPSEAPLITFGQRYTGQLNNHESDANYGSYREVALWRLPPVSTRDVVVVNWHSVPFTSDPGRFPVCMAFAQDIDDFNWGSVFGKIAENSCYEAGPLYRLSPSGTSQTTITVQETNADSTYLEFTSFSSEDNPAYFETYPYDFSVEAPRHYLGVAITPVKQVRANGILRAAVTLADGSPAPDGLPFSLTATWTGNGISTSTGATVGGTASFALALPEAAVGKRVTFVISRAADPGYQAASSTKLVIPVTAPSATAGASPCTAARRHARSLTRQYNRLKRRASLARSGPAKRRLNRRAHSVARKLRTARSEVAAACAT